LVPIERFSVVLRHANRLYTAIRYPFKG